MMMMCSCYSFAWNSQPCSGPHCVQTHRACLHFQLSIGSAAGSCPYPSVMLKALRCVSRDVQKSLYCTYLGGVVESAHGHMTFLSIRNDAVTCPQVYVVLHHLPTIPGPVSSSLSASSVPSTCPQVICYFVFPCSLFISSLSTWTASCPQLAPAQPALPFANVLPLVCCKLARGALV